jgi:hypothetical protein
MGLDRVYWFPPKDPAAMAATVQRWREELIRMGPSGVHREVAVQRFSLDAAFGGLIAVYREILAAPR